VPEVVHISSFLSSIFYMSIGILGAITLPHASQNMLESLMSGAFGKPMQLCASIFAFFIVGLGCPLFSVLARMNLMDGNRLLSRGAANMLAVYLPFLLSWLFYQGEAVYSLLAWGGTIFTSLIAFVLPLFLAYCALEKGYSQGSVDVYQPFHVTTNEAQNLAIRIILTIGISSILVAILGNFF